ENLAELYRAQGRTAEAEPLLSRSRAIREKTDPAKCAFINVANMYLRCANFYAPLVNQQQRLVAKNKSPQNKAALDSTLKVQADYIEVALNNYKLADRKFEMKDIVAREKIDRSLIDDAYDGSADEFMLQDEKRSPPKSSLADLCSIKGLGAD